jgi:hypothetical protein
MSELTLLSKQLSAITKSLNEICDCLYHIERKIDRDIAAKTAGADKKQSIITKEDYE